MSAHASARFLVKCWVMYRGFASDNPTEGILMLKWLVQAVIAAKLNHPKLCYLSFIEDKEQHFSWLRAPS